MQSKCEKIIKEIIQKDYHEKLYFENEIPQILSTIIEIIKKNHSIDDPSTVSTTAIQYLYHSPKTNKYYFNYKRKQTVKKRIDHNKIVSSVKNCSIVVDINSDNEFKSLESTEEEEITQSVQFTDYVYPANYHFKLTKRTEDIFGPYGTQWFHDPQVDDEMDTKTAKFTKQFEVLRAIKLPDQRTEEWYKMREGKITASDGGTVIDLNSHEPQYKFILKKTTDVPFLSNEFVHHGKKYEDIATIIYEYRMNVSTSEFGLIGHPVYSFLGASPDRICNQYKLDGVHLSKYVGRMLEIKCPLVRKIKMEGEIIDHICPIYYWVQVQLQLECCDLEECDFWQAEIREYASREEFIKDTDPNEPFRSKTTQFEKGCLIQLLPKKRMPDVVNGKYKNVVEDDSKYIYPPKIEMSPYDCDIWIMEQLSQLNTNPEYSDYYFDKVLYWKLVTSKNVTIYRDKKWFEQNLPKFEKVWNYVLFLRENKDKLQIVLDYIDSRPKKKNKDIMDTIDKICNINEKNYNMILKNILDDIKLAKLKKEKKLQEKSFDEMYMFVDDNPPPPKKNVYVKTRKNAYDDYQFIN